MSDRRRALPAVNALLTQARQAGLDAGVSRAVLTDAVRAALDEARAAGGVPPADGWLDAVARHLRAGAETSLRRVVNATGVVLHTNLGRAPLAAAARLAAERAMGYAALEYDLDTGARGSRQDHLRTLLVELTGGEEALVVTNAAAAVLLLLSALGRDGETIVSRGELVEIGGAFRIPEILAKSGSVLVEVGTTNRTRVRDYELAVSPRTRLLLKVHRSNFAVHGFVAEASVEQLVALGRTRRIPVIHDVGSGLLMSLERFGLHGEPLVQESVAAGATAVFSGDKLLGGPQAGILVGPGDVVRRAAEHPLARALRPDKTAIAALEATLRLYRDERIALAEIPTLRMLTAGAEELRRRARRLARRIEGSRAEPGRSAVGGGAFSGCDLPTTLVTVPARSCATMLEALRRYQPPVIARALDDRVALDVRTLADDEFPVVAAAIARARQGA